MASNSWIDGKATTRFRWTRWRLLRQSARSVRLLVLLPLLILVAHANSACVWAQHAEQIASQVQPFVDRHELAGAVMLVADKDNVLAVESVGWADAAAERPMSNDSIFWIASQSKPIN